MYSIPSDQYLVEPPCAAITFKSLEVPTSFGSDFCPFFLLDLLQVLQFGCMTLMDCNFQTVKGEITPKLKFFFSRLKQLVLDYLSVFCFIHSPFNFNKMPSPGWGNASPQHDAAIPMPHCWDGVWWGMNSVQFAPHIAFRILLIKAQFLITSDHKLF